MAAENITNDDVVEKNDDVVEIKPTEPVQIAAQRRAMWRGAVEQELQMCVQEAAGIRKNILEAKTSTKKKYYEKKFAKVQTKVMQMVAALQRMQAQEAASNQPAPPQEEEHVHDENCQHDTASDK